MTVVIGDISNGDQRMTEVHVSRQAIPRREAQDDSQAGRRTLAGSIDETFPYRWFAEPTANPDGCTFAASWKSRVADLPQKVGHEFDWAGSRRQIQPLQQLFEQRVEVDTVRCQLITGDIHPTR